jgi:hypothetical protein
MEKTDSHYRIPKSIGEGRLGAMQPTADEYRWLTCLFIGVALSVILVLTRTATAVVPINPPILISESTSTRAIAMESVAFTREPFSLKPPYAAASDERTRIMVFVMNLALQPGEDLSVISADAEDATHNHYPLTVESIRLVPSNDWMSAVVFKLNDDLGDVGDVLVSVSYHNVMSNRVRIGIGHVGGGPADDSGAVPTPAPPYTISGQLTGSGGEGLSGISITLSGAQTTTVVTGNAGFYSFTVTRVGDYTVAPVTTPYYTFGPQTFASLHNNQTANFAGTLRYYTVSGWLTLGPGPASFLEVPISGSQATSFTTDANGQYSISLQAGGNYTITPSARYYAFSPVSQVITDLTSDQNRFFIGTRQSYTISGRLIDENGNGLAGMTVHLTGAILNEEWTRVSDQSGYYEFAGLPSAYDFTVTPVSTAFYVFRPQSFTDLSSNQTFDFTGLRRLTLSGRVRDQSGNGIFGIRVTLIGSETGTTITAGDGSYSLTATATGNYTVTPSIPQGWYTFAPAGEQFNNLAGAHTTDFTATLAPLPNPSSVLEFDGQPKTVDYGNFWQEGVNLGHFFWEFWAMPGPNAGATYMLSDGYGGAHALLFGVGSLNSSEPNRYELLGNIFDGVKFDNYFGSDQGPAIGEWAHFAVGWDGQNIITYYNGVPVGKTPFAGPRRTPGPGGGGGRLLIGGSDHSNFDGRIAQVRGYEDSNPRESGPGGVESSFAPQTVFGLEGNLLSYYFRSGGDRTADLSRGYNRVSHSGWVRGTLAGILFDCGGCPPPQFVIDPSAPSFAANAAPSPVSVPTPAAIPSGALVFDSFSRPNSTYLFGSHGGLGAAEGGSAGTPVWQTNRPPASPQPFGILNSIAVLLASDTSVAWVPTGSATARVDVRVNRRRGRWGHGIYTGLSFRVVDANNFFFAYTTDDGGSPGSQIVKIGYYLDGQRVDLATSASLPLNWTTLRVITTDAGDLKIYADDTLVYSANSPIMATATGAGLYNNSSGLGLVNRWDNFTVFNAPG